jgi:hypothetical protein
MADFGAWLTTVVEYALLMRVPLITGAVLVLLPWIATRKSTRNLLLGLFDVTPAGLAGVALAATSVAGIVSDNARIIYLHSSDRGVSGLIQNPHLHLYKPPDAAWFVITACLSLPVIGFATYFSNQQNLKPNQSILRWVVALGTMLADLAAQVAIVKLFRQIAGHVPGAWFEHLNGYHPIEDHVTAAGGFTLALLVYLVLGVSGYRLLGKKAIMPALCSVLMVMMLLCSSLSALSFLLDLWHLPVLTVVALWGLLTAQSANADHHYDLKKRAPANAPTPIETLRATKPAANGRVVVVAANGGGIQAAAWTAYALQSLGHLAPLFENSVRLISSVSGGSLGSACYTYRRAQGGSAREAADAASSSSLDEVAWGLSWPDLIKSVVPWFTGKLIGRGRALEIAWCENCATPERPQTLLDQPLSNWNASVATGDLPAVIMNSTIVESGQRLLFGTTRFTQSENCRARVDATALHGPDLDVAAVTAARLSATFPYVTPASRSHLDGPRPHIVDGGYYDNYGMSTLVEWLDEALREDLAAGRQAVKSVLVIQLLGAPAVKDSGVVRGDIRNRGWFFQILAPLLTLNTVRGAGQVAHNDLELKQLQEIWFERGVPVHTVTLEFPEPDAPLSWHMTQAQKKAISDHWQASQAVQHSAQQVVQFLAGQDKLQCPCPTCQSAPPLQARRASI